jgi:dolichol-phosphate mannosyltransferase
MISVVIPLLNEESSLVELHRQLSDIARSADLELEMIFVSDGSTDGSWSVIQRLHADDPRVRGIRLRRNFGKAAALDAGFRAARGGVIVTMDADLQDDPAEIPKFLALLDSGYDVASGWKRVRHDPWHKVWPSRVFNSLVSSLTGVRLHDHNCGFKAYRREIFDEIRLYGELHRFVPVLAAARGWKVTETEVRHRARTHGHSKYGLLRIPKGFLDLLTVKFLTGYGQRPQHMLGTIGLIGFGAGLFGMVWLSIWWIISRAWAGWTPVHLHQRAIFYYSLGALIVGAQFLSVGFLAELITALLDPQRPAYSVAERLDRLCAPDQRGDA